MHKTRALVLALLSLAFSAALGAEPGLIELVDIPAGRFALFEDGKTPPMYQNVDAFSLGKYEVTQAQFQAVMGYNPSRFASGKDAPSRPVESVSWFEAIAFCNRLSLKEGLEPVYRVQGSVDPAAWGEVPKGDDNAAWSFAACDWKASGYRLPSDMEYRWASKGGKGALEAGAAAGDFAWYKANSLDKGESDPDYGTHPVGGKRPNAFGLYDIQGNVWEWGWDWGAARGYRMGDQANYRGPEAGLHRILRGGSWWFDATLFTTNNVNWPGFRHDDTGFRVARTRVSAGARAVAGTAAGAAAAALSPPRQPTSGHPILGAWICEWNDGRAYVAYEFAPDGTYLEKHRNLRGGTDDTYDEFRGYWTLEGDYVTVRYVGARSNQGGELIAPDAPWRDNCTLSTSTWFIIDGRLYRGDMAGTRVSAGTGWKGQFVNCTTDWIYERRRWLKEVFTLDEGRVKAEVYGAPGPFGPWDATPERVYSAKFTGPDNGYVQVSETTDEGFTYKGGVPIAWDERHLVFRRPSYVRTSFEPPRAIDFGFDRGASGWRARNGIKDFSSGGGELSGLATNGDPFLMSDRLSVRGDSAPVVRARVRAESGDGIALYWITEDDTNWNEEKAIHLPASADGAFHDYLFRPGDNPRWAGRTVVGLRLDPLEGGAGGRFAVDSVRGEEDPVATARSAALSRHDSGDHEGAIASFARYAALGGQGWFELAMYADSLYERGRYAEALPLLERALSAAPGDQVWWMYYRAADLSGRLAAPPGQVVEFASRAIAAKPDEVVYAYAMRANAYRALDRLAEAASDLESYARLQERLGDAGQAAEARAELSRDFPAPPVEGRAAGLLAAAARLKPNFAWSPASGLRAFKKDQPALSLGKEALAVDFSNGFSLGLGTFARQGSVIVDLAIPASTDIRVALRNGALSTADFLELGVRVLPDGKLATREGRGAAMAEGSPRWSSGYLRLKPDTRCSVLLSVAADGAVYAAILDGEGNYRDVSFAIDRIRDGWSLKIQGRKEDKVLVYGIRTYSSPILP